MRILDIIEAKILGRELTDEQISQVCARHARPGNARLSLAALLMAIRINGMTDRETVALTREMAASGDELDLSAIDGVPVDKHSTGGVGDTTSLILVPLGGRVRRAGGQDERPRVGLHRRHAGQARLDTRFCHQLAPDEFIAIVQQWAAR